VQRHPSIAGLGLISACLLTASPVVAAPPAEPVPPRYPEGAEVPRHLTEEEREWVRRHPITAPGAEEVGLRGVAGAPEGPIWCPPEYAPMEGILIAWEGSAAWLQLLTTITREITAGRPGGGGYGDVWVVVDTASEQTSAAAQLAAGGADMSRVRFVVRTTDTIWIRDYGPRYIYQGQVRAIVNHTYNRPRPADNAFAPYYGTVRRHNVYNIPLVHGGGNFHLDALGRGYATGLIVNENPSLSEGQIVGLWQAFQNLATHIFTPYPSSVDSTQHLDMWMQVAGDDVVLVSDFISNGTAAQNAARDAANAGAAYMAANGYTVHRLPARNIGGTHYTYTNVVMCNGVVLVPQYSQATMVQHNAEALATWQAALPDWRIVGINCDAIVTSAGVMHCIVMHVPAHLGGQSPTAFLRTLRGGETLTPGSNVFIRWGADDDRGVTSVRLLLSHDGGQTYATEIASGLAHGGSYTWNVPDRFIRRAKVRVVVEDADGNTGYDESPETFRIAGSCTADWSGDGSVNSSDISEFLTTWLESVGAGDLEGDFDGDMAVNSTDISAFLSSWLHAVTGGC